MADRDYIAELERQKEELIRQKKELDGYMKHSFDVANFEANIAFDLASAIDILVYDIESRYKNLTMKFAHEKKKAFKELLELVGKVHKKCDTICDGAMDFAYGNDSEPKLRRLSQSYELVRLCLLFADRTALSNENYADIFNYIIEMDNGINLIDQEDFDRFNFKPR